MKKTVLACVLACLLAVAPLHVYAEEPSPTPAPSASPTPTPSSNTTVQVGITLIPQTPVVEVGNSVVQFENIVLSKTNLAPISRASMSDWSVKDFSGSGAGWRISVSATPFTEVNPPDGQAIQLPQGSLVLVGDRVITAEEGSSPVDPVNGPIWLGNNQAIDQGPVVVLHAKANHGMGIYHIDEPTNGLELRLAANTLKLRNTPTTFQSTITYTFISGE